MKKMTEDNIKAAFAGESQAHMRYLISAGIADRENKPNLARLFNAIAFAETQHATNHLKSLEGFGDIKKSLDVALAGETFEIEEMYPAYEAVASLQGEDKAVRNIKWALDAENVHAALFKAAQTAFVGGGDAVETTIYVCPVCGHTVAGSHPDNCPLCHASGDMYKEF